MSIKTYTNRINGKDYLYAYDNIFIAKGKTKQKNKSLGPVDSLADIEIKKRKFYKFLKDEEKKHRIKYWEKKAKNESFHKYIKVEKIEDVRTELYREKEKMGSMANSAMETAFLVDFIYNSNKIEGSKIPRESVEKQVRRGGKSKNDEVGNTLKALYYVNNEFKFTIKHINKLHSILLHHEPNKTGFREEKVIVGNSEVTDWKNIKIELKTLLAWYKNANKTWYPPELAFAFYYRFERIHPFIDGNGRTGRLIINKILKDHKYHPMIIWDKKRKAHLAAFEGYNKTKGRKYYKFMSDQFVKTHQIYIEKIQKAFDLEDQLNYFLKPSSYNTAK